MPSLYSRLYFLEFTHAEPKYTCVPPSRSQWAVAALTNSCSNDPYVPNDNHMSTMDVMVTVISTLLYFVCTVCGTVLHKERRGYLKNFFLVDRSLSLPVHGVTHFSVLVVMGMQYCGCA